MSLATRGVIQADWDKLADGSLVGVWGVRAGRDPQAPADDLSDELPIDQRARCHRAESSCLGSTTRRQVPVGWARDGVHGPWRTGLEPSAHMAIFASSFCLPPGRRVLKSGRPFTRDNQAKECRWLRTNHCPFLVKHCDTVAARWKEAPQAQRPEQGL